MPCKNTDLLINNVDRQVQPCLSKISLSENVYMMFGGNAMSQKAESRLLCSTMPSFRFRHKPSSPVRDSRVPCRCSYLDVPMHGVRRTRPRHLLDDGGGGGTGSLSFFAGLAFGGTGGSSC